MPKIDHKIFSIRYLAAEEKEVVKTEKKELEEIRQQLQSWVMIPFVLEIDTKLWSDHRMTKDKMSIERKKWKLEK